MKLGLKILSAPLVITATAIGGGLLYAGMSTAENSLAEAEVRADQARFDTVATSREEMAQVRAEVYRSLVLLSSLNEGEVAAVRSDLAKRVAAVRESLAPLVQPSRDGAPSGAPDAASPGKLDAHLADFAKRCDKAIDLSGMDPNIGAGSMRAAEDSYKAASHELQQLVAGLQAQATSRIEAAHAREARMRAVLALVLLASGAAAAFIAWRIGQRVVGEVRSAVALCEDAARGKLTSARSQPGEASDDEIGDLQRALGRMVQDLNAALCTVRDATDQINTAGAEIASGNLDLSQRTEQSASSLQQTAASMEELTGTVAQTADAARTANQLAQSASDVAQRGGDLVSQVVGTMQDINQSSRRIADIIGTIDGIAFQTNILALNAAVEAARAGEQGRGFAVVASEVRSLAQRSATAAREIKSLIGASLERVEAGTQQVATAGSTMQEIVASVQRVSDIIGEIAAAAVEQSSGIGLVNGSVTQLDTMTQQNAALVEQSAAAAESLKHQAQLLAGVVGRFELR